MFGAEQYIAVVLGVAIHILMKMVKAWKEKGSSWSFIQWKKDNLIPTIVSILITIALIFIMKDFLQFDLLPLGYRNLLSVMIGYKGDSIFKNLMAKKDVAKTIA